MDLEQLLKEPPLLHQQDGRLVNSWKLGDQELLFLLNSVRPGMKTIETGAGLSTIALAMLGAFHTAIAPDQELFDRINGWCLQNAVSIERLEFIVASSQTALPALSDRRHHFDLAIIDGSHAFPMPFLDWLYLADLLKVGGLLIIDDLHIWTCETLAAFLAKEPGWEIVSETLSAAVFRKLDASPLQNNHYLQPYVAKRSREASLLGKLRYLKGVLERRNLPLFWSTVMLGIQSALRGKFGRRERR